MAETLGAETSRADRGAGGAIATAIARARSPPRVGPVTLLNAADAGQRTFSTEIFQTLPEEREQAFVLALMEMVVQGVSTRKVSAITEELCRASFSKSTVSALCAGWTHACGRSTSGSWKAFLPFVLVDALFVKAGKGDRVVFPPLLRGIRHPAAAAIADSRREDRRHRASPPGTGSFRWLKGRGLQRGDVRRLRQPRRTGLNGQALPGRAGSAAGASDAQPAGTPVKVRADVAQAKPNWC